MRQLIPTFLLVPTVFLTLALPASAQSAVETGSALESLKESVPSLVTLNDAKITEHHFRGLDVVRVSPVVNNVSVEGADTTLVKKNGLVVRINANAKPLVPLNSFSNPRAFAVATAQEHTKGALINDASVERLDVLARRVYLATERGLIATYKVRIPTLRLRDLQDHWVNASNGVLLKSEPVARFAAEGEAAPETANVFEYSPAAAGIDNDDLVERTLPNLLGSTVGEPICGEFITTRNCCKAYVCLDGSGECELEDRRCANADDEEPITSILQIEVPTDGFNAPIALPEILYAQSVICSELPILRATDEGYVAPPVDVTADVDPVLALATEADAFAEVQAYYTTMQYFLHTRDILEDPTFCLADTSMKCDEDGNPILIDGLPELAFHVTVNSLLPEIDVQTITGQLIGGLGAEPGNPIIVDRFQRLENAAFIPAFDGGPADIPAEFQDLAEQFLRPYDSNVYFQGNRDFAYDGDIVAHEFTHAIIYKLVPNLGQTIKAPHGISAEPGALNEGLSDYFASAFTNSSAIGEYGSVGLIEPGEIGLRDSNNAKACATDINGEVHDDAEPWTGALWEIRESIAEADRETFDAAVFSAIAQAQGGERFETQAERVLSAMGDFSVGDADAARAVFEERGMIGCDFTYPLAILDEGEVVVTPKERMFMIATENAGVADASPAPVQFRVEVPAGTPGFLMRWKQTAAQGNGLVGGSEPVLLRVLANEQEGPFVWRYEGEGERFAIPTDPEGNDVAFDINDAEVRVTPGPVGDDGLSEAIFAIEFDADPCTARTFYVQMVSADEGTVIQGLDLVVDDPSDEVCDSGGEGEGEGEGEDDDCACSSSGGDSDASEPTTAFFAIVALGLVLRRRKP